MSELILKAPVGANKKKRIVGRGSSSGRGTTAGRGNKGQQSRSGGKVYIGFEGGQMPLFRRIAQRGFSNYPFKKEFDIVNLCDIELKVIAEFAEKFHCGKRICTVTVSYKLEIFWKFL